MLKFNLNVAERKILAKRLEELTGIHPIYTRAPLYAYEVGDYTIDRDGNLLVDEAVADQEVLTALMTEGLITGGEIVGEVAAEPAEEAAEPIDMGTAEATAEESAVAEAEPETEATDITEQTDDGEQDAEPDTAADNPEEEADTTAESEEQEIPLDMDFSLPLGDHNGVSLRNLVNLIYSRASLINKATGAHFRVSKELVDALRDDACTYTVPNFRKALADFAERHGESGMDGFRLEEDKITFCGFPTAADVEHLTANGQLVVLMNNQALMQKRIQAKTVNEDNEKYAMRIWLIRLGMNGDEFKPTRKIIMENLGGHTAFRTSEEAERAKQKALEKRRREKAVEQETEAQETEAQEGEQDEGLESIEDRGQDTLAC